MKEFNKIYDDTQFFFLHETIWKILGFYMR